MAETQNIQETAVNAMKNLARENDKLGALIQTLSGVKELRLDERQLEGLRYMLEDVHRAADGVITGQMELAAMNALAAVEAAEEAKQAAAEAKAKEVTDYQCSLLRDC